MGVVVQNWKIKWILISIVFLSLMYSAQAMFGGVSQDVGFDERFDDYKGKGHSDVTDEDIADVSTTNWVEFATFQTFDYPEEMVWFSWLLSTIVLILVAVNVYIIYAFARELIPLF